jgi:hypothetical protein
LRAALLLWSELKDQLLGANAANVPQTLELKEEIMSDMDTSADRPWTFEAVQLLRELAREGVPVPVISLKLKRSIAAIHAKLAELGLTAPSGV